jgi:hypothetical protein
MRIWVRSYAAPRAGVVASILTAAAIDLKLVANLGPDD